MKNSDFFPKLYEATSDEEDRILIQDRYQSVTKAQLVTLVQTIQHNLIDVLGIQRGDRVGFCADNSVLSVALEITLVHLGITFVPLSQSMTFESLSKICQNYEFEFLFLDTLEAQARTTKSESFKVYHLQSVILSEPKFFSSALMPSKIDESYPAYILLTSGSTGMPKPVGISYRNLYSFIENVIHTFQLYSHNRFISISRLTFDLSLFDIFASQKLGAYLYILNASEAFNPYPTIVSHKIDVALLVPSVSRMIASIYKVRKVDHHQLRLLFFCGELLNFEDLHFWEGSADHPLKCVNLYGPTEATVAFSFFDCSAKGNHQCGPVPIGVPFQGQAFHFQETSDQTLFELQLIGSQVSDFGYIKTNSNQKFVQGSDYRSFMTGDLVKVEEGQVLWNSRTDHMVKIMGHRIDLDGLSSKLFAMAQIIGYFVLDSDRKFLICFVMDQNTDLDLLLERMQNEFLPIELPRQIIRLDEFPLGPHGKVSKSKLQEIFEQRISK